MEIHLIRAMASLITGSTLAAAAAIEVVSQNTLVPLGILVASIIGACAMMAVPELDVEQRVFVIDIIALHEQFEHCGHVRRLRLV